MSLLLIDGFEGYAIATGGGTYGPGMFYELQNTQPSPGSGRGGSTSLLPGVGGFVPPYSGSLVIGYAVKQTQSGSNDNVRLYNGANQSRFLCAAGVDGLGRPYFKTINSSGTETTTTITVAPRMVGVWRYVEHKITIGKTTGTGFYELRIDEAVVFSQAIITNELTVPDVAEYFFLTGRVNDTELDDFYILDTSGAAPHNDYLGDCRMQMIKPNGAVVGYSDFTPTSGANWQCVDDTTTSATDYVETQTVGDEDRYEYEDIPTSTPTIFGLAVMTVAARVEDAGPRQLKAVVEEGGTATYGPVHQLSQTPYIEQFMLPTNPDTGALWTPAEVNAMKAGFTLHA